MRVIKEDETWENNLRETMGFKERVSLSLNAPVQVFGGVIRKSVDLISNSFSSMVEHAHLNEFQAASSGIFRKSSHWDRERSSDTSGLSLWHGLFFAFVSGLLSGFLFGFIIWIVIWVPVTETLGWELVAKAEPVVEPVCWHWKLAFVILTVMNTVVSISEFKYNFKAGDIANF